MTVVGTPEHAQGTAATGLVQWVRTKDPDHRIAKRSFRGAILVTATFAIAHEFFASGQVGLLAAFGAFSLSLMVEFTGPVRARAVSYLAVFVVSIPLIAVGTAVSTHKVAAIVVMFFVGFGVLFAGIVAPQAAAATTLILLNFVLPVAVVVPPSQIGNRLLGWTLAGLVCIPVCLFVWPPPWRDDLRRRGSKTADAIADLVASWPKGEVDPSLQVAVNDAWAELRSQFSVTPYPPTGSASRAVAVSKLVGRLEWVSSISSRLCDNQLFENPRFLGERAEAVAVIEAISDTLHKVAGLICDRDGHPVGDPPRVVALQDATRRLDAFTEADLLADVALVAEMGDGTRSSGGEVTEDEAGIPGRSLDPGYHVRGLAIAVSMVADACLEAAGAAPVSEHGQRLRGESSSNYFSRMFSHLSFRSVWFRNALRGAIGLALAVLVIEVTDVQHGFWVALGTISVLRSNAADTGASVLRAVGGTTIGVIIGSSIMIGVGDHTILLWVLLPLAAFVAGASPGINSFVGAQAGFTVLVIILFNIIQPVGWKVGLTRIEDIGIGCAVSLVVGLLFWPRGATAALGRALSDAYVAGSSYLADAVDRLTMTRHPVDMAPSESDSERAYLLLDDAFRQFLTERGTKVVSVQAVSNLFMGSNRLRLGAYSLGALRVDPPAEGQPELEAIEIAEAVLRDAYASTHHWYERFAEMLADGGSESNLPRPNDETLHHVLRAAFDEVRAQRRPDRVHTALQMLWADELLEDQNATQADLVAAADLFRRKGHSVLV